MTTKIEWCTESWNPVTGCTPIGEGCKNCYARAMAHRFPDKFGGRREPFKVTCHPDRLNALVLRKRKPQRIFVCSMSDLFHKDVPRRFINQVLLGPVLYPRGHTFIVLTKRAARMCLHMCSLEPLTFPNLWLGVSVSTQREADELIPILLQGPAAKRIVSYEPALEAVDFSEYLPTPWGLCESRECGGCETDADECDDHKAHMRDRIDWLICGCESGPKRRYFDENWARDARDACVKASVPFFYKQGRDEQNRVVKMPLLDGRRWEEYPC